MIYRTSFCSLILAEPLEVGPVLGSMRCGIIGVTYKLCWISPILKPIVSKNSLLMDKFNDSFERLISLFFASLAIKLNLAKLTRVLNKCFNPSEQTAKITLQNLFESMMILYLSRSHIKNEEKNYASKYSSRIHSNRSKLFLGGSNLLIT